MFASSAPSATNQMQVNCIDVKFVIHGSNWSQTMHRVSKETTVGTLNLHFGFLTGALVPEFHPENKVRMVYYNGYKVDPNTRLKDLCMGEGQTKIEFHFVWCSEEEQTLLHCDEENIDKFFQEQDGREFQEEFLHDLELYYEDQLYTAQDHAERKPSTMTYALAAQKAAIERHHQTAVRSVSFAIPLPPSSFYQEPEITPANISHVSNEETPAFSMCIPRVFPNINERRIRAIFYNLGYPEIDEIDFVKCEGRSKKTGKSESYNRVFIHFKTMAYSAQSLPVQTSIYKMFNGEQVKIMYDEPWYWMVSLSRSNRPAKRPTPPQIMLNDPRENFTEHEIWGECVSGGYW